MKPTQQKPTKAEALAQNSRQPQAKGATSPRGATPSKGGKPAPKAEGIKGIIQSINPIMIAAGSIVLVLLLGIIFYFAFGGNEADTVQPQETTVMEVDEFGEPDAAAPNYPPDYFLASPTPIDTLATQLSIKILREHPSYAPGIGFTFPDGTVYQEGSPELQVFKQDANARILMDLNSKAQIQIDAETGEQIVVARDETTGQMLPLSSEVAAANFENQSYRAASLVVDNLIAQQSMQARNNNVIQEEVQTVEKKVVIESVLTDDEKRKYITLIDTQERENQKLRDQMADVQKDMREQRNQVIDVIQRIENSPSASQKLRASMLPKIAGLQQHSIVGDRVWFIDKEGNLTTYSIGEVIDGTSLMISGTDEGSGVVLVTPQ